MNALPNRKLRVGVTLVLRKGFQSIWENGIFQNCAFLVQLLNLSPAVERAVLVIDGDKKEIHNAMMLDDSGIDRMSVDEAVKTLDVIIEMSAQLSEEKVAAFRQRGGRYAWMRVGNDYVIDIERAIFKKPQGGLCNDKVYDAVWTIPEYQNSCTDYFALTTRAPVKIVPHLWSPYFFEKGISTLPKYTQFGYQPGRKHWRVCTFEPNVCMVKTSLIPMLGVEEAYREDPSFIEFFRACNTLHMKDHLKFSSFARRLDIVNHGLTSFEARFAVYEFMANYGDCIISHQWENGQNYLYYEALYGNYPLIHNSQFIDDCGYYYPDFDTQAAGKALLHAHKVHDEQLPDYQRRGQALLAKLDVKSEQNIGIYTRELLALYNERR